MQRKRCAQVCKEAKKIKALSLIAGLVAVGAVVIGQTTAAPERDAVIFAEPPAQAERLRPAAQIEKTAQTLSVDAAEETAAPAADIEPLYTDADAQALAQMAWGECRGVGALAADDKTISGTYQKAATMWCVLNRYDAGFEDSIVEVAAAPYQFHGYSAGNPVDEELLELAYDVLERWQAEKNGGANAGRILPAEYLFFVGDGEHNYFSADYHSGIYYAWELPDVYAEG